MSTVMSQQPLKEDEEEEDEEQGEEFIFEDSADDEKPQEDSKGVGPDNAIPVQLSKKEGSETSDSVSRAVTDSTQLPRPLPPQGQEEIPTKDVTSFPTAGTFSILEYWLFTGRDDRAVCQFNQK